MTTETATASATATATATKRLLALYAHPDDEAGCSGTMSRYAEQGVDVRLICATRGELGEISDPALATVETLPQVREQELRTATAIMGIAPPEFLDYRDSGMAGWEQNNDPRAYVQQPDDVVIARLATTLREFRPQAIITFDPTGGYGHPDHLAIHKHAHAAVALAANASADIAGEPWQVTAIWYCVFPRSFFLKFRERLVEIGADTSDMDRFEEMGIGFNDDDVRCVIDVSDRMDMKFQSTYAHRTQFGGDDFFSRAGEDYLREAMSREYFGLGFQAPGTEIPEGELL